MFQAGAQVTVVGAPQRGYIPRLAFRFPKGVVQEFDVATRTYTVLPANSGRPQTRIPEWAVVAHVDNSAEAQTRNGQLSGVGAKLVVEAQRRADAAEAASAAAKAETNVAAARAADKVLRGAAQSLKKVAAEKKRRVAAEAKVAKSQAAADALVRGDSNDPSLTRKGRAAADAIDRATDRGQLRREYEALLKKAEQERLKFEQKYYQKDQDQKRMMTLKNAMAARAKVAELENKRLKTAKEGAAAQLAKCATHRLPEGLRERMLGLEEDAAEALARCDELEIDIARLLEDHVGVNSGADFAGRGACPMEGTSRSELWKVRRDNHNHFGRRS
jgi:hypothetical protein